MGKRRKTETDWRKCGTQGARIEWAITVHHGMTVSAFCRAYKFKQSTISSNIHKASKKSTQIPQIADKAGVDAGWLGAGRGSPYREDDLSREGRVVGRRFDELSLAQRDEVIRHMDWIIARDSDEPTAALPPLKATIDSLRKH